MEKIIDAITKMLPETDVKEVTEAIKAELETAKAQLQKEYDAKLEEAYAELTGEVKEGEKTMEQGYQEAYAIITDLRNRLETQRAEFDKQLEEGYEEAYQMLLAERGKKETLESELYEQYDNKLAEMKGYMIDKIDQFLQFKGKDIYEQARRDVLNDPALVDHKITLNKVIETVAEYISDEDYALATSSKLEEASKSIDDMKGQLRILEARNIRLAGENKKLNESVKHNAELLKEAAETTVETNKNERVEKAKNVQGRGKQVVENVEVIAEAKGDNKPATDDKNNTLVEGLNPGQMNDWRVLSGIPATK